jgi:hypothetical protein
MTNLQDPRKIPGSIYEKPRIITIMRTILQRFGILLFSQILCAIVEKLEV